MKLFISTDLGTNSSGDIVVKKELEAMRLLDKDIIQLGAEDIAPTRNGLPDIPFLIDYLTLERLSNLDITKVNLAHMYGGTYTQTVRFLKNKGIKTTYTCVMHDRKISIEEHEKFIGLYPFSHVKDDRLWPMYIGTIKEVDIVITPGNAPKNLLIKEGCKKVEIIPHGCNIPNENIIEQFPKEFRIGYLGAVGPDKGLTYLIRAWEMLNYNDSTLIFAGSQTEYLAPFINKYVKTGKFHLMGYVKNVADFYNNISIYVQPSVTEGFGMEVPEAMSHGRPVIVSDGAGAADVVTDGVDGFVIPKKDPRALADKIDWCYNHQKELEQMGKNAREKAKQYSWNNIIQKYIDLWRSL